MYHSRRRQCVTRSVIPLNENAAASPNVNAISAKTPKRGDIQMGFVQPTIHLSELRYSISCSRYSSHLRIKFGDNWRYQL
jgi:hypothetical protein